MLSLSLASLGSAEYLAHLWVLVSSLQYLYVIISTTMFNGKNESDGHLQSMLSLE
jgi:hypothetical protein